MSNKVYCKGLICKKYDRKEKCCDCNKYVCESCSIVTNKQRFCIDCFVSFHLPNSIINDSYADTKDLKYSLVD